MRLRAAAGLALALSCAPAFAQRTVIAQAQAPAAFGGDHDDPRIAEPGVPRPDAAPCGVESVDRRFDASASYTRKVPREQRGASARSPRTCALRDSGGRCANKILRSLSGRCVDDRQDGDCGASPWPPQSFAP